MKIIVTSTLLFAVFACSPKKTKTETQSLYEQVMKIHDEAMPKLEEIIQLRRNLKEKLKTHAHLSIEEIDKHEKIIQQLDSADFLMMDWMHTFKPMPDSANQEKAMNYLKLELLKIENVKNKINTAIENGRSLK